MKTKRKVTAGKEKAIKAISATRELLYVDCLVPDDDVLRQAFPTGRIAAYVELYDGTTYLIEKSTTSDLFKTTHTFIKALTPPAANWKWWVFEVLRRQPGRYPGIPKGAGIRNLWRVAVVPFSGKVKPSEGEL